ncbi:MAG: S9 family peptidase [Gammaproteobacteria bacterium]|jgi:dipeptidyl aminopeptidase/acylaminoacyl peptidase|nr:S9 family peptidase [Gammaproteobacteria bacterium]MBU2277593.1 S9 family peptidase [Gammaproteobacteria bacterium]
MHRWQKACFNFFSVISFISLTATISAAENTVSETTVSRLQLPVEAFASIPSIEHLVLSPNGQNLALMRRYKIKDEHLILVSLYSLKDGSERYLVKGDSRELLVYSLRFANDQQLLMRAGYPAVRHGTPVTETRLMKIDLQSGKSRNVLSDRFLSRLSHRPQIQDNVVDYLDEEPNHLILALRVVKNDKLTTNLYKVSLDQEAPKQLAAGKANQVDWMVDRNQQPRLAVFDEDTKQSIVLHDAGGKKSRVLWSFDALSADEIIPLGFDTDPNLLYVSAYHQGRKAIFRVDLTDEQLPMELMVSDEQYDVPATMSYSAALKKVIALGGRQIDKDRQLLQKAVDQALPERDNTLVSSSSNQRRMLILSSSEIDAGQYLLLDRDEGTMDALLQRYEELPPEQMVAKKKITYKTRDDLDIEGFLTLPLGAAEEKLPTIIFPHGGPISNDHGDFDYWTQFFANRGYAVLQMNFRGSSGYGFDFMQAGLKNWGLQMQDDVEDGTNWLIKQGVADPKRICIVGASYGGYAALMGAVKTPDLYRCVVSFAGVTDLQRLVRSSRAYTNGKMIEKIVGGFDDQLDQRSPVEFADKITAPVLLMHGTKDRSVPIAHSRAMRDELNDRKKPVQYIEFADGDHYLSTNEHRVQAFQALDKFLQKHLQPSH